MWKKKNKEKIGSNFPFVAVVFSTVLFSFLFTDNTTWLFTSIQQFFQSYFRWRNRIYFYGPVQCFISTLSIAFVLVDFLSDIIRFLSFFSLFVLFYFKYSSNACAFLALVVQVNGSSDFLIWSTKGSLLPNQRRRKMRTSNPNNNKNKCCNLELYVIFCCGKPTTTSYRLRSGNEVRLIRAKGINRIM